ncbi:hypothetical protein Glove_364g50 [Diversispora epigaea]|uniref:Uncharacterized protein n=1 Tax=Diversispora epigaea TaxID=1348612 RepID=A0A397HFU6_9GLOM|nr:hypothetical protein Glove_364g50 [Diversispora epigaea]
MNSMVNMNFQTRTHNYKTRNLTRTKSHFFCSSQLDDVLINVMKQKFNNCDGSKIISSLHVTRALLNL